jgi:hypothetical protein
LEAKDPYNENHKTLKKEIEEDTRRWKDLLCSWTGRICIVKMATLPKALYRFNAILIKIPVVIFFRNRKINTEVHLEAEKTLESQSNSEQEQ